ncbi:hypothetical protein PF327_10905 [Sulfurovum sp. XTW-4]|uniref:HTH cro/C1-type domain-containing protein n=1 Tax=Sulfurovum xiamenensis TaxID=3019066 RepID=A0ABT7QUS0_9BACT|nr:hypothetical protein [Sulfurovum xiamenensis]MDM5264704.1 hypothetical protein [Sulfurovum xiamenensis]
MKRIKQEQIADLLSISQSNVSKKLRSNSFKGHEMEKILEEFKVPISIFFSPESQEKYLGKSYLQHNTNTKKHT